ncbi:MAG: MarR family transcriptional regulator [Microlunatus sp.]|nr:MarR family transcriptional regulator [Microlunatus sp.]
MTAAKPNPETPVERDEARISRWIEEFAGYMVLSGVPRMPARVLSCLLVDDEGALTSAQLAERLKISPAAVSGAIRYLTTVHMVRRTRRPGARREIYRVDQNMIYSAVVSQMPVMARWEASLDEGARTVGPETAAGQRLAESAEFIRFVTQEYADLLERWQAHQAARSRRPAGP